MRGGRGGERKLPIGHDVVSPSVELPMKVDPMEHYLVTHPLSWPLRHNILPRT